MFSWPGVGRLLVVAVANRDLAVVQCILLLVAVTMVSSNLIVDLLYGFLDPRLRTAGTGVGMMSRPGDRTAGAAPAWPESAFRSASRVALAWIGADAGWSRSSPT